MIRKPALTLCLLLSSLLALSSAGPDSEALSEPFQRSFARQLGFIAAKKPKYTWGGASDISVGLDCSGYIFLAGKWAGLPGITRTTAFRMSLGLGGWNGLRSELGSARQCDLVFWTFDGSRPNGHVGAVIYCSNGRLDVVHSSAGRGVISQKMNDYLKEKATAVLRLSFGD